MMFRFSFLVSLVVAIAGLSARPAPLRAADLGQAASVTPIKQTDVRGYVAELDRVSRAVSGLAQNPNQIAPLRNSLPNAWLVRTTGQNFTVSTEWLVSSLATMESAPQFRASLQKDLLARLDVLRQEAEAFEKPSYEPDPAAARARISEILQRREFRSVSPPGWFQIWRQRIGNWIGRMLRRIFRPFFSIPHFGEILISAFVVFLFLLLAALVVQALLQTARTAKLSLESPIPAGRTWRDWAREALDAAARRDYRDAVRRGYWAGIFRLQDLGALKLENDRTPREYLSMLGKSGGDQFDRAPSDAAAASGPGLSEQRAALVTLTRRLEFTWYGFQTATDKDFRETIANLEALGCRFPSTLPTVES